MGLSFSRFYHSRDGQGWRWYLKDLITDIPLVIKSTWQRSRRGWADCDVWSIDDWFQTVMPQMLRQLAKNNIGTPMGMFPRELLDQTDIPEEAVAEYHENWTKLLLNMADDLEAHIRYWDEVSLDALPEAKFDTGEEYTPEEQIILEQRMDDEEAAYNKVKAGLATFCEWFYALWD